MLINTLAVVKYLSAAMVILSVSATAAFTQNRSLGPASVSDLAAEMRPFDYSSKYYISNGVDPELLMERRDGFDGLSVFDYIADPDLSQVRITGTWPAYTADGSMIYFTQNANVYKESFLADADGDGAHDTALRYQAFLFPSATVKNSDRQAALLAMDGDFDAKNFLGLFTVVLVDYTTAADTPAGRVILDELSKKNGLSLDGTPIIRTRQDIDHLVRNQLITLTVRSIARPGEGAFIATRVLKDPTRGAIAPDAILLYVKDSNGVPLAHEAAFVENFECLAASGQLCPKK